MIDLSWGLVTILVFGAILLILFGGMYVAGGLGLVGILAALIFMGKMGVVKYTAWMVGNSFVFSAIPLFILMGNLLLHGQLSKYLYEGSSVLVGKIKGGLLHANVVSCAIFAAVCGSSAATAASIGTFAIPELQKKGYNTRLTLGSLAAGGTLGIMIPPSIAFIVYGVFVEQSVGTLFIAGVIPGIMLALLFMAFIFFRVLFNPSLAPRFEGLRLKTAVWRVIKMWPIILLIFIIMGGIYTGVFTPTEAAAVAATAALILSVIFRNMTWSTLQKCLLDAVKTTVMMMYIIIGASMLSGTLGLLRVPSEMATWVSSLAVSPLVVLLIVYAMYLFLGCFLEGLSMLVLTIPIVYPILSAFGYDPIWFGVVFVLLVEIAALTPPVGLNIYVIHGLSPERPITDVIRGSMPFFICQVFGLVLLTAFPQIALWLPGTMLQ